MNEQIIPDPKMVEASRADRAAGRTITTQKFVSRLIADWEAASDEALEIVDREFPPESV